MRLLDDVRVLCDDYRNEGITRGMIGTILDAEIYCGNFFVNFQDQRVYDKEFMSQEENIFKLQDDIYTTIKIKDLEVVKESGVSDKYLFDNLLENHKDWWCKVEDGYILNLKGERKNKVAYDYES